MQPLHKRFSASSPVFFLVLKSSVSLTAAHTHSSTSTLKKKTKNPDWFLRVLISPPWMWSKWSFCGCLKIFLSFPQHLTAWVMNWHQRFLTLQKPLFSPRCINRANSHGRSRVIWWLIKAAERKWPQHLETRRQITRHQCGKYKH